MKPELYKWLSFICSSYNTETGEYDETLSSSQVLYIVLSYFFLMDEQDIHISDLRGNKGLEGVVSALNTKIKLVTISQDIKYLFIENPKNSYKGSDNLIYRLTFVKLVRGKNGEWGTNIFGTAYKDAPYLDLIKDSYNSEEDLSTLLDNLGLKVSWHCTSLKPSDYCEAIILAQSILDYYCDFSGYGKEYEKGISTGDFRNNYVEGLQNICYASVILDHFAYYLKRNNLTLDEEPIFDLGNGINLEMQIHPT